ncbi:sensor histidine kinase [Brucella sp. BO3]|uniref:ATP-binding protein n=1 Tax=unclassified Brucella TaxID=2632610 RepID=UPI00084FACF5|nr:MULTISPECIES: ATP-binding protein [unclassified Brucella]OEI82413.1 hypothetical protein BA060_14540 [Brucella sp. B13-0095]QMV25650.1 sensor histidine kinase [Brucella sp. BO3]
MRNSSLKFRVLAVSVATTLLTVIIACLGLLLLFERHVERRMVLELDADLRQIIGVVDRGGSKALELHNDFINPRFNERGSGLYWQIYKDARTPLSRSISLGRNELALPDRPPDGGQPRVYRLTEPDGTSLLAVERDVTSHASSGTLRAVVAIDRKEVHHAGLAFASDLAPSLVILAVLFIAGAWIQALIGMKPLDTVRLKLADVRYGRRKRLGQEFPDEIRPLAGELDRLLDVCDAAMAKARERAANLAHGLKTPLTVLHAITEEIRRNGDEKIASELETLTADMERHVERELAHARTGAVSRSTSLYPVRPVVERMVTALQRIPKGENITWEISIAPDTVSPLDAQDLAETLGNLIDNAMKWAGQRIRISARYNGNMVELTVEDDGPGIPEERRAIVLIRGGRADEAAPGTGLGLAIVGDLVDAYGGSLSLNHSTMGGLKVKICLPRTCFDAAPCRAF